MIIIQHEMIENAWLNITGLFYCYENADPKTQAEGFIQTEKSHLGFGSLSGFKKSNIQKF